VSTPRRYLLLLACLIALNASCGRKAPPTWTNPLRPPSVEDLRLYQRPGEVLLRWDYPENASDLVKAYEVTRSSDGSKPHRIAKTKETTYHDTGLEEGKIYTYSVVARTEVSHSKAVEIETVGGEPPPPPHNLTILATGGSLELTWQHPVPGVMFNVYRTGVPRAEPFAPVGPPVSGTTTALRLVVDSPVYYTVRALAPGTPPNVTYESVPSNEVGLDPAELVPAAPVGLSAVTTDGGTLLLWTESPEPWVRLYHIYRAGADGAFALIGDSGTPAYTASAPPAEGGPWTYRVSAVGPGGEGPPSETVAAPAPEPKK
jgi:hypothetical protein